MSEHALPIAEATDITIDREIKLRAEKTLEMTSARLIPLSMIKFGANTRETGGLDKASINELAASIKERGVIQPITVRQANGQYEVIAGTRRVIAARQIGSKAIPAIILDINDDDQLIINIIENVQRENLNLRDTAHAVRKMLAIFGKPATVAQKLGKSKAWVSKHLTLTSPTLPMEIGSLMESGKCTDCEILTTLNQIAKHPHGGATLELMIISANAEKLTREIARSALEKLKSKSIEQDAEIEEEIKGEYDSEEPTGKAKITFELSAKQAEQFEALGGARWLRKTLRKLETSTNDGH